MDDIVILQLTGKLALGRESQRIEALVEDFARYGRERVILDMSGVNYIDSAGIGLLALAAGKLKQRGGRMVVVTPAESRTTHLLKLTQMDAIIPICASMEEARTAFA